MFNIWWRYKPGYGALVVDSCCTVWLLRFWRFSGANRNSRLHNLKSFMNIKIQYHWISKHTASWKHMYHTLDISDISTVSLCTGIQQIKQNIRYSARQFNGLVLYTLTPVSSTINYYLQIISPRQQIKAPWPMYSDSIESNSSESFIHEYTRTWYMSIHCTTNSSKLLQF